MYILDAAMGYAARIQEIAFGVSLIISALFLLEYKKYAETMEKQEMLDQFLKDQ
jgi:hypothetical protein